MWRKAALCRFKYRLTFETFDVTLHVVHFPLIVQVTVDNSSLTVYHEPKSG